MINEIREYALNLKPKANPASVISGDKFRITVLTGRLIRLEYCEENKFFDEPSIVVSNREFDSVPVEVKDTDNLLKIKTENLNLYYNKKAFSPEGLWITLEKGFGVYGSTWNYGDNIKDLKGTARTLDNADGEIPLESGLMSREGFTVLDDSDSPLITEDGWVKERDKNHGIDIYFFGYGHDYLGCLNDFYKLCGKTPLLPRYMLGNFWSRYYPYSQNEYIELMDKFKAHNIPLSVSVIDMDWHKVRIPEKYGSGWTGYSFNKELIPDPDKFLSDLKERNLRITLNLHPADGVKAHEDAYIDMAKALGVDYENEERIPFDCTSKSFMEAYFKYLHNPLEDKGVDFWWVDWQQGTVTRTPGIDALWMLNYLHFLDLKRGGKRSVTFSRYAGIGSHRFPIGFSGDSVSSWQSLAFQPYFTANASNAGYAWWSHDIGGHQNGNKDDELVTRWIQFGVFSPIMRLHSTSNPFYGKEPWNYNLESEMVNTKFMQLRHKLIPYLYSANYTLSETGVPLVMPMYYLWDRYEAYEVKNEYYFGKEMIVSPITESADAGTRLGSVKTWLPEGKYYDFFTGFVYSGNRFIVNYRSINEIPVFVKAGSIIPLAGDEFTSHYKNPDELILNVYHGDNGEYTMYEDDCKEAEAPESISKSHFKYKYGKTSSLSFWEEAVGKESVIPKNRRYIIKIHGVNMPHKVKLLMEENESEVDFSYDAKAGLLSVIVDENDIKEFTITLCYIDNHLEPSRSSDTYIYSDTDHGTGIVSPDIYDYAFDMINRMQISYNLKAKVYEILKCAEDNNTKLSGIFALKGEYDISDSSFMSLYGAILELLTL